MPTEVSVVLASLAFLTIVNYLWGKSGKYQVALGITSIMVFLVGVVLGGATWYILPYSDKATERQVGQVVAIIALPFFVPAISALYGSRRGKRLRY